MSDEEQKIGYIKVNGKAFREWCKSHDFDCFSLDNGREAWCSRLGTYFRGASGVAYADGEPFLFYEEDLVDVDKLINQALTAYKKELMSKAEIIYDGDFKVNRKMIPLSAIQEDEAKDIDSLIQQEQLKLLERIEGEVVGDDVVNESNVEKYGREKPEAGLVHIHQDSLRRHQRKLLDQLKAEIKGE